jgi:hypothetical protein
MTTRRQQQKGNSKGQKQRAKAKGNSKGHGQLLGA